MSLIKKSVSIFLVFASLPFISCSSTAKDNSSKAAANTVAETSSNSTKPLVPRGLDLDKTIQRVSFGSCVTQDQPQPLWTSIERTRPDLYLAMGDNVYASRPEWQPIARQYQRQDQFAEYRSFREKVPFMATWDDHDIGVNDGGADAVTKAEALEAFMNYFTYAKYSREMNQEGVYNSKIFGKKKNLVQIIMLDTRYFRSPLLKKDNVNVPNTDPKATILGEAQWKWLEAELKKKADFRIVVSSIQLIATDHVFEKWANYPLERQRFFDLLKKTKVKNLVVLSGDRHLASVAKVKVPGWGDLYDVTSSSINRAKNLSEQDQTYVGPTYGGENFGLVNIDWSSKKVNVEIRDIESKVINGVTLRLK